MGKDNSGIVVAIIVGILFISLFAFVMLIVIVNYVQQKRKIILDRQKREAQYQQELLQAQLEMQEQTLKTISQEIHDNVGQILSLAKMNLNILTLEDTGNGQLSSVKELVSKAITDLRDLSKGYYAERLAENGLLTAIRHELEQLDKTGLLVTHFTAEVEELTIDKSKTIFIYRMVQEILHNVMKHASAKNVYVRIFRENGLTHICIKDDGKGFSREDINFKPGIGLSSIQNRAGMIDATAVIESEVGNGTTFNLTFNDRL
jgi:signal transduction histidine kinase